MNRQTDMIAVAGVNGDHCIISPPGLSWGPELAPGSTGLFEMPLQTNWGSYAFGQFYKSWKPKRRDVVWTINIKNPLTGTLLDQDSDLWHTIYSRWCNMFDPEHEAQIQYTSVDGERTLGLRTLDTPKPFSSYNFEGGDPHLWSFGSVVQTMAAELPFYVGKSKRFTWETPEGTTPGESFWFRMPYFNASSVDIWSEWDLDGGAEWILPDYSYGSEAYGRGQADIGKTVPIPELRLGENVTVMSRPDMEWIISEWETDPSLRSPGFRHEYPIPPGKGSADPERGCVVRCVNAQAAGLGCVLTLPSWHAEPFSTARIA